MVCNLSRIVYKDFATAHNSAFQWWVTLSGADRLRPPAQRTAEDCDDGLIYYDPNYATNGNQTLYFTKRYYALGQYSKFVRPGAVAHNMTGVPDGVEVLDVRRPTARGSSWSTTTTPPTPR